MNMGQGIAMFGQSIGDAIRRSREKEKKKKEKEEMRQALLKFGVPETMADMIGGDSELFKNFSQLKQLEFQQRQLNLEQEKIRKMNQPSPAEVAQANAKEVEAKALQAVLDDPSASQARFGVFAKQWKGGSPEDAYQFNKIFGKLPQPEKGSVLKSYLSKGYDYPGLLRGDLEAQEVFYGMGGKASELGSLYRNQKRQEEESFEPTLKTITGEDGKTYNLVQISPNQFQYLEEARPGSTPTEIKLKNELTRLAEEGDVMGVTILLQKYQKQDFLGRPSPLPDFAEELLDKARKNAKK